jgi:Glycosyl hydrolase family 53
MIAGGVPADVIGLSYYPFFHGPLADMRANVDALATRYGKPIVIAESQYPWTLANGDRTGNFVWQTSQVSDGYPATPGGQLSFLQRHALDPRPGAERPRPGTVLLGGGVDSRRRLGARRRVDERQPDAIFVHRAGASIGGLVPEPGGGLRPLPRYDPSAVPCEVPDGATTAMNW